MPANLPPQYHEAEKAYQNASNPEEKLAALQEMLAVMPKHKGTDKLQAELRKKISRVKEEKEKTDKKAEYNPYKIKKEGAGQLILLGYPNTGKSSLLAELSNAPVEVANYPFTTNKPQAGMIKYEDVQIQVIDTPPLVPEDVPGPMIGAIQRAAFPIIMIDAASGECLDQLSGTIDFLRDKRIVLDEVPEGVKAFTPSELMIFASKIDIEGAEDNLEVVRELYPDVNIKEVSFTDNINVDKIPGLLFDELGIIRVYSKEPGKEPEPDPFTLPRGSTVLDFARSIHKDLAENLKKAKLWGSARFPGQPVPRDYVLEDEDIVEIHASS